MKILHLFWNPKEKRLRALVRLVIFAFLFLFLTIISLLLFSSFSGIQGLMQSIWLSSLIEVFVTLISVLLSSIIIDRRHPAKLGLIFSKTWWKDFGFGIFLGAFLMSVIFLTELALGWVEISGFFGINSPVPTILTEDAFPGQFLGALAIFISVGIYEELLVRGYLMKNLAEWFNHPSIRPEIALIYSTVIASAIFGLLHSANPNSSAFSTIYLSLAGIFLSLGVLLDGSLAIPIGLHISWNLFQGSVFGFPVSGMPAPASLIQINHSGPDFMTGGAFGPEAGLVGLTALALGSFLTLLWYRKTLGEVCIHSDFARYQFKKD